MAEPYVILRNRDRFRRFQATLYHKVVCVRGAQCICLRQERTERDRKGEFMLVEQSVDLPPLQESEPLPRIVLEVPQIQAALNAKWLETGPALAPVEVFKSSKER